MQKKLGATDVILLSKQNKLLRTKVKELELWTEELTSQNAEQLYNLSA